MKQKRGERGNRVGVVTIALVSISLYLDIFTIDPFVAPAFIYGEYFLYTQVSSSLASITIFMSSRIRIVHSPFLSANATTAWIA